MTTKHILVVDDNPAGRRLCEFTLRQPGWRILTAENGREALNLLKRHRVDLVVSDVLMPVMDGFRLCHEIRRRSDLSRLPFVLYTSTFTDENDESFARRIGADRFLRKPCAPAVLIRTVQRLLAAGSDASTDSADGKGGEKEIYLRYNQRLVEKLEKKMLQLQLEMTRRRRLETERRVLEAKLQRARKMEALGSLAGGIAHDFNNILAAMLGYLQLAAMQVTENDPAALYLGKMEKAGSRAKKLVDQILAFSRQSTAQKAPVAVSGIIDEVVDLIGSTTPAGLHVRKQIEIEDAAIEADSTQIHQILMNLCTNAVHAMGEAGGILTVGVRRGRPQRGAAATGNGSTGKPLMLFVEDTGEGMSPEVLAKIFEPFFTTREIGEGSGLGLATVKKITESLQGRIEVDSQPGRGTVFRLFFPAAEPKMPSAAASEAVLPVGTERLLYVEHDSVMGEMGKEMMASLGYSVVMKSTADEALKWLRDDPGRFDALIADARLMGTEHIREVKRAKPAMPLILCRGFSANTKNEIHGGGVHAVLMKPLLEADLARTLRAAIDGRRQKRLNAPAGAGA